VFKFITISLLICLSFSSSLSAREINLNTLAAEAAKQHKHLFVWLHKTDCGYCEAMREFTLEDDRVAAILKKSFRFIHINVNDNDDIRYKSFKGSGKAFAKKVGYSFYPSSLFMDKQANLIFAAAGYIEEKNFLVMLKYVESAAYRTMKYDRFRQQEGEQ
jgi:thioredoxin-related protein